MGAINENGGKDICQGIDVDTMKVVDSVERPSSPCRSIVGDIGLCKEVRNICSRVDDWSPNNAYGIRDIGAANVRLQKWGMNLSSIDGSAGLGIQSSNPILRRGKEKELLVTSVWCVDERFRIELNKHATLISTFLLLGL